MAAVIDNATHPAFEKLRSHRIDTLNLEVEEYRHRKTGARHLHLAADNDENVFFVALRTFPMDSTGVAHILEHTALCGSERFPVRDPFFMMIRRSLNTFMNAFTSSDWTAYPFASMNRKDFDNLLSVYLDCVFFSKLDPLDFAQEGHRLEFSEPDNPDSELQFKGVVFNEMKGAMSSIPSQLWQAMCKHLFPTTTYHYNSGGDPERIPDLSYDQLVAFYRSHYHPGNAIFMTFGDIPAREHHSQFDALALSRFEALEEKVAVGDEQRFSEPLLARERYAFNETDSANKHHVVVGWLLGSTTDLQNVLEAQLLTNVLLDNSASPLQQALETSSLGNSPSPLCGLEDSMKELVFVCGLEGCTEDSVSDVEQLVLDTITRVADEGIAFEQLEAMLNQLELTQREISGDSYPYGLQLLLTALGSATHRGDPIALLDMEPAIAAVREKIVDPDYIKQLTRRLLLDNRHRVTLHMAPDDKLGEQKAAAEKARLASIKEGLNPDQKQAIIAQAAALQERQQSVEDESILPKVGLEDISQGLPDIPCSTLTTASLPATAYKRGTNGLVYQQLVMQMPQLPPELAQLVPYYTSMLTEVGLGSTDYLQTQTRQAAVCGSINAFNSIRGGADNEQQSLGYAFISSKALTRFHREQSELIRDTLEQARFDEHSRLRELLAQQPHRPQPKHQSHDRAESRIAQHRTLEDTGDLRVRPAEQVDDLDCVAMVGKGAAGGEPDRSGGGKAHERDQRQREILQSRQRIINRAQPFRLRIDPRTGSGVVQRLLQLRDLVGGGAARKLDIDQRRYRDILAGGAGAEPRFEQLCQFVFGHDPHRCDQWMLPQRLGSGLRLRVAQFGIGLDDLHRHRVGQVRAGIVCKVAQRQPARSRNHDESDKDRDHPRDRPAEPGLRQQARACPTLDRGNTLVAFFG